MKHYSAAPRVCHTELHEQLDDTALLNEAIVAAWLGDAGGKSLVPSRAALSPAQIDAMEGHYLASHGPMITLQKSGADIALTIRSYGLDAVPLNARIDGTLDVDDSLRAWNNFLTPIRDEHGAVTALRESNGGGRRGELYRRVSLAMPTSAELQALTGRYRSEELDTTYRVALGDGRLVVTSLWLTEPLTLSPTAHDQFESSAWWLQTVQFQRSKSNAVTGFAVHAGRVRNVLFVRVTSEADAITE